MLQVGKGVADLGVGIKLANLGALDVKLALVKLDLVLLCQRLEVVNVFPDLLVRVAVVRHDGRQAAHLALGMGQVLSDVLCGQRERGFPIVGVVRDERMKLRHGGDNVTADVLANLHLLSEGAKLQLARGGLLGGAVVGRDLVTGRLPDLTVIL